MGSFFCFVKSQVYLTWRSILCYYKSKVNMTLEEIMKNRIREFREQHGLTQKELGGSVGVSRQAIHAVETGKFDPSIWLAHDLAHYFGVTIEELFDFTREGQ